MRDGTLDEYAKDSVILRSSDLTSITERTPIPTSGVFPDDLVSPFPNWTAQQVHSFLKLHAPGTKVHDSNFVIIDARSLHDYTCKIADNSVKFSDTKDMRAVGHELKTLRATFRDSILSLVNWDIANTDIEESQMHAEMTDGVSMVGETEEGRKKDLEDATLGEKVLRNGRVIRD
ncbi:MAG: hypothetical protein LQ348_006180 [Seirophora lacunosa]|nr:MAG: hypothetical protein LQ344_005605 [Seirophora lacunosa]KAI4175389.1 MAG: hypothetical protein LQ348_006180 [Seirophora lacunosa]